MNSAKLSEDDFVKQLFVASTHDYIMYITNKGKAYWMKVHEIPEGSRTSRGAHIKSLLAVSPNEDITTVVAFKDFSEDQFIFMGTARGVVKKVQTIEFANAKTRGIIAINLDEGDNLVSALLTNGSDEIVLITRKGQALRTEEAEVRASGRSSRGVCGIKLDSDDELAGVLRVDNDEKMLILSEFGYGKRVEYSEFSSHGRATGGQRIYTVSEKTGELVGCVSVGDEDSIMCITSQGKSIKVAVNEISVMGRSAQGVRIVNIERPDFVIGVDRIAREKDEEHLDDSDENQTAESEAVDPAMEPEPESQDSDLNEDTEV